MTEQLDLQIDIPVKPRFDGEENEQKWMSRGMPKGIVPDQYVNNCRGGAVNLHILNLGQYTGCYGCDYQKSCRESAACAREQMDWL